MILLDYRDSRPIYEQVKDGLRQLIVTGALGSGEKLPSVRALAGQLTINPNTIQRAYAELEQEGFVVSVTGKGSFVAEGRDHTTVRKTELIGKLRPLLTELQSLGMTQQELLTLWKGEDTDA